MLLRLRRHQRKHQWKIVGATEKGNVTQRPNKVNEDWLEILEPITVKGIATHCTLVLDGMGGRPEADRMSRAGGAALSYFWEHCPPKRTGSRYIKNWGRSVFTAAHQAVYKLKLPNRAWWESGTTAIMALYINDTVHTVHCGDSPALRFSLKRGLEQFTIDHDWAGFAKLKGLDPPPGWQCYLESYLGKIPLDPRFDYNRVQVEPGDIIVTCTDGLINCLGTAHLSWVLAQEWTLEEKRDWLVNQFLDGDGGDDMTFTLAQYI